MTARHDQRGRLIELDEFKLLSDLIRERVHGVSTDYYPSPGNWGDALINVGTNRFFEAFGISCTVRSRGYVETLAASTKGTRVAIIGGGGGWNRNWNSTISFASRAAMLYRDVVVLPSSYDPELIEDFPRDNVLLVARGKGRSLQRADVFCHDMAFALDVRIASGETLPYPLIALRRDKERNWNSVDPDRNWDLSLLGDAFTDVDAFFKIVSRFSEIWTDRLHIGIAGALIGVPVHLFDGNYGKVHEVFQASLRVRFPNVSFHDWREYDWSEVSGFLPIGSSGYTEGGAKS